MRPLCASDRFLLICCDGVWDVLSDDDAVRVTANLLRKHGARLDSSPAGMRAGAEGGFGARPSELAQLAAEGLVDAVLQSGRCTDNVTVILVLLSFG